MNLTLTGSLRLIPAHAGKTGTSTCIRGAATAHPRSRGENMYRSSSSHPTAGSSPLTRGKHAVTLDRVTLTRLIPAHAGKTVCGVRPLGCFPAHPRSRGENWAFRSRLFPCAGSSPLTRGKLSCMSCLRGVGGLIPAHAGKTNEGLEAGPNLGAHPRSRGENRRMHASTKTASGSSPLTRGKRFVVICLSPS